MDNTGTVITYNSTQSSINHNKSHSKGLVDSVIFLVLSPVIIFIYLAIIVICSFLSFIGTLGLLLKSCFGCCKDCDKNFKNCIESHWETLLLPYHKCVESSFC